MEIEQVLQRSRTRVSQEFPLNCREYPDHKILPKWQELFDDICLTSGVWLARFRVPSTNWLIHEDDVTEVGPSPCVWNLDSKSVNVSSIGVSCRRTYWPIGSSLPYNGSLFMKEA